ncbi:MAG TPA: DUF362 domain-containing protein [Chitinophagaceae bacterium]
MKRRYFLKAVALTGIASTLRFSEGLEIMAQSAKDYDLVAVLGGEPALMFKKAITEIGGMGRFVKKGQKVVVKPNIGWDRSPELAANTNPELVSAIIRECFAVGAREVVVFDHTCDDWRKCYQNSGIDEAVKKAGGKMMPAHEESYYREVKLPQGVNLKSTKIHQAILDCDVWINVPVLKMHGGARMSVSLKNLMGIVWDRRYFHSHDLQQCIADCNTLSKKAVLNIVDAYRVIKAHGPQGRSEADVALAKGLFISTDTVAVDTAAIRFYNQIAAMDLAAVEHVGKAEALRVGTTHLENLSVKRIKI